MNGRWTTAIAAGAALGAAVSLSHAATPPATPSHTSPTPADETVQKQVDDLGQMAPPSTAPPDSSPAPGEVGSPYRPATIDFDRAEPLPPELVDVDVTEKLGQTIDLNLEFTDTHGRLVKLNDYFDGTTPVILNLTYFRCPMSCPAILQNMAMTLRELELEPGEGGYRVLTVSIDPTDTVAAALKKQEDTLKTLAKAHDVEPTDWPFLVGPAKNSRALADAVGYGFKYLPGPKQYTHRDVVIILSPEGKITRYLYGRSTPPMNLQLSLVEASEGKVGSTLDHVRLFCFYYTGEKKYALRAKRLMTAGGALTVFTLSSVLGTLWFYERRKAKAKAANTEDNH